VATEPRVLQPPAGSFFLFGLRGTGKSTGLAQRFPEALRIDLLAPEELRALQARPERLRERVAGAGRRTVVIDNVQKAPALLDVAPWRRQPVGGSSSGAQVPAWRWISCCMGQIVSWRLR
jgi:predicted AAA+ superfamily ATPase